MNVDEKIELVKEVGEENVGLDELKILFEKQQRGEIKKIIAYDGFEPSGQIHIAQGLLRAIQINKLTKCGITFVFWVADYFAWLNNKFGGDLEKIKICGKYLIEIWKSCGMNLENIEFKWASEELKGNSQYLENFLRLSKIPSVQRVLRCGQIMGRSEGLEKSTSQIVYPLMQANDIRHLNCDICQLGLDQRKVNVLARDIFPKLGWKKPVIISHHMLLGLQKISSDKTGVDKKIEMKMSKSKPDTAIFMTDTKEEIERKFRKAYCIDCKIEENPILEYFKFIVFESYKKVKMKRDEKFGGNYEAKSYEDLEKDFGLGKIKSIDLKIMCSKYIDELLESTRKHFEENKEAKYLLEKVKSFQITR